MFTFQDKGERSLTLRPEGTAPSLRAYLDSPLASEGGVTKIYYIASIFRQERGAKGRYRQHEQCGVEALGSDDPALDAEVIQLAMAFFRKLGLPNLILKINSVGSVDSRAGYLEALKAYVAPHLSSFTEIGQSRFEKNPFRLLDTKDEKELEILASAPRISEYLSDDEKRHLETVCGYIAEAGIPYELDPYLVRGFDYYTRTAFEIQSPDVGAQSAVGGGGRYNRLVEELGGKPTPGIGFGIVPLGDAARQAGIKILADLRGQGISADIDYTGRSMKAQMRAANKARARYAVILGDDEIAAGAAQLRDLNTSTQSSLPLSELSRVFAAL
jgi:histidyl-tRNA synthetase